MQIINPATEEIITILQDDSDESLQKKLKTLQKGQKSWAKTTLKKRIIIIKKFSELLAENIEELALTLTSEMGKPLQQARNEVNGARVRIKYFVENSQKYLKDEIITRQEGLIERISYEPLGVVCNISAWNYPFLVGVNVFIPALIGGNTVMYKPSEFSTLTGLMIEKLLKEAGIPEDVFAVAVGAKEVGEQLLKMPFNGYFFTGSYRTGLYIYEKIAPKMVVCQLELGGKDPLYIAEDVADIQSVAAGTADGAFYNNGQSCCAVERIYVHEKVYDRYVEAFVKEVKSYKIGQPTVDGIYIGALSRKSQLVFLEKQVQDAVKKGATLLSGGKSIEGNGFFFEPTVLTNVTHKMDVMREESFGPIIGIMKVKDDKEATKLMQDTEYGLTAAVYTADKKRAEKILKQVDVGSGYWNCCDRVSAPLPWSGRKNSGFGATLSHAGIRAFVKPKAWHLRE
jgi:acyl-CoA reductase-like NAD-dependent aldehyde dehydrogenase